MGRLGSLTLVRLPGPILLDRGLLLATRASFRLKLLDWSASEFLGTLLSNIQGQS
jgi:hypothetical protein